MDKAPKGSALDILERHVPGFGQASGFVRSDVANNALVVSKTRGTVLFAPGSQCAGMLLLDDGLIRVSRPGPKGRELTLYRVSRTEICVITVSCVLAESAYPARGVVERDIVGVLLPLSLFRRLSDDVPAFRSFIFDSFAARVSELIDLASAVTFEHLDSRLASLLLRECKTHGKRDLQVTHQDLASELGTVRERVSRLLENFETEGLVALRRGCLTVVDCERLREASVVEE